MALAKYEGGVKSHKDLFSTLGESGFHLCARRGFDLRSDAVYFLSIQNEDLWLRRAARGLSEKGGPTIFSDTRGIYRRALGDALRTPKSL